jgi:trans-2,3-dihydro-3-hydroxyanthranilate isomerase
MHAEAPEGHGMADLAFLHVDVFTQTPFEGNPLAVFTDARGLDTPTMQRIAREMNLSETTFVFPATRPDAVAKIRIFTPGAEMMFAGHPTIGTTFVLQRTGAIAPGAGTIVLEEGIGPVAVRIDDVQPFMAWLTTPPVSFGEPILDRAGVAAALSLDERALRDDAPVRIATAGNPFLYVALRSELFVDAASLDARAIRAIAGPDATSGVYVFATRDGGAYSRMFAPEHGIIEDPATGSATGPLAAYMLEHGLLDTDAGEFVAEQGTLMGRRSILRVRVGGTPAARTIEVGGSAVALIEGVLRV